MANAIIYSRVSTEEQKNLGYSLQHQKYVLETYCRIHDFTILKHYEEDFSAKNFNRPEFTKLLSFVKKNKNNIDYLFLHVGIDFHVIS